MAINQTTTMERDVIEFPPNQPLTVACKYAQPKPVTGRGGEDRAMFTLTDGRLMFVDLDVAYEIRRLGVKAGEPFQIEMRWNGKRGEPKIYLVKKLAASAGEQPDGTYAMPRGTAPSSPAAVATSPEEPPESNLMRDLRASFALARAKKTNGANGSHPPAPQNATSDQKADGTISTPDSISRPQTRLAAGLIIAVEACHAAQQHAREIGYAAMPQFTSEDVRTMANTLMIQAANGGGR